eukprot:9766-Heterococcus_DN1.PRE.2
MYMKAGSAASANNKQCTSQQAVRITTSNDLETACYTAPKQMLMTRADCIVCDDNVISHKMVYPNDSCTLL